MKKVVIYIRMGRKENDKPEKQLNVLSIAHRNNLMHLTESK